jgi:8-oxo-dGTP pyrophosphatase MutT (NUDIX family)
LFSSLRIPPTALHTPIVLDLLSGRYAVRVSLMDRLASRLVLTDTHAPEDGRRRAAVAALLHDDRVLLMKRTERAGDPWSGHISLPGGRHDPRDPDLLATAVRETREELGIDLGGARVLGNLNPLHPRSAGPSGVEVTPFVFATTAPVEPMSSAEAESAFWLPLELARSGSIDATYTYPGSAKTFPSWTYGGYVIWGLTMRILGELLEITKP